MLWVVIGEDGVGLGDLLLPEGTSSSWSSSSSSDEVGDEARRGSHEESPLTSRWLASTRQRSRSARTRRSDVCEPDGRRGGREPARVAGVCDVDDAGHECEYWVRRDAGAERVRRRDGMLDFERVGCSSWVRIGMTRYGQGRCLGRARELL